MLLSGKNGHALFLAEHITQGTVGLLVALHDQDGHSHPGHVQEEVGNHDDKPVNHDHKQSRATVAGTPAATFQLSCTTHSLTHVLSGTSML
jgi:hypothetical protein